MLIRDSSRLLFGAVGFDGGIVKLIYELYFSGLIVKFCGIGRT